MRHDGSMSELWQLGALELAARIKAIHFTAGDLVEEGDLLIEFDDSDYQIAVKSAQAAVEVEQERGVEM